MKTDNWGGTKSIKTTSYHPGVSTFAYRTYMYGDDETPGSLNIKKLFTQLLVFHTFGGGGIPSFSLIYR